jgi:phosphomannomutase
MRSVSGVRGIVGETFTPEVILRHFRAFIDLYKIKTLVIGRDSRPTGPQIQNLLMAYCQMAGVQVISLGLASTPTVELMVQNSDAEGGVIITASHNPVEWNALKFLKSDGTFPGPEEVKALFKIADHDQFVWPKWNQLSGEPVLADGDQAHIQNILGLSCLDLETIRKSKFRVAVDSVNGAGSFLIPALLKELGCQVFSIYDNPDGTFPRGPEPIPEALIDLGQHIRQNNCDVGFALDPDADRCALCDESGSPMGEEYTLAIAVDALLAKTPGPVTINLSSSLLNQDVAQRYGQKLYRSEVGEINVSLMMKSTHSIIGGEGNGGVILPESHYGRDSAVAVALVLQWMASNQKRPGDYARQNQRYYMVKQKLTLPDLPVQQVYKLLQDYYKNESPDLRDGVWVQRHKSWVHLRASNTEPILRIMAEASSQNEAESLANEVQNLLKGIH